MSGPAFVDSCQHVSGFLHCFFKPAVPALLLASTDLWAPHSFYLVSPPAASFLGKTLTLGSVII